jgi:hypothetical protein
MGFAFFAEGVDARKKRIPLYSRSQSLDSVNKTGLEASATLLS